MTEYGGHPLQDAYEDVFQPTEIQKWNQRDVDTERSMSGVTPPSRRHFSIDSIDDILFTCDKAESATSDISLANHVALNFRPLDSGVFLKDFGQRPLSPPSFHLDSSGLEPLEESKEAVFVPYQFTPRHSVFVPRNAPLVEERPEFGDFFMKEHSAKRFRPGTDLFPPEDVEGELFSDIHGSRRHSIASSQNVFACPWPGCSRFFSRAYNLRSHYLIHTGSKPYICEYCGLSFARNHDMRRHLRVHSGDKPYACPNCDKGFSRQDALTRHRRSSIKCQSLHHITEGGDASDTQI